MPKKRIYKTTAKDFKYFKKRVKFWQKKLGGSAYLIYCIHEKNGDKDQHASYQKWDDSATVKIYLNKERNSDVKNSRYELDLCAFHEVFEAIYLATIRGLAMGTYSKYEVEQATHKSVHMATNSIFEELRNG